jgi:hypothetical protein
MCRFEQWHELETHLPARERKGLNHQHVRRTGSERFQELATTPCFEFLICTLARKRYEIAEAIGSGLQRRQVNDVQALDVQTRHEAPPQTQVDHKALFSQRISDPQGAKHVTNAKEMLHVEENALTH